MGQSTPKDTSAKGDAPLNTFSACHVGIMGQLAGLAELPDLVVAAKRARRAAGSLLTFFDEVVVNHHGEEEEELFPAVLASARPGEERDRVQAMVDRLTREHREVEKAWSKIKPALRHAANGRDATLDADAVQALVARYRGHAAYEESEFLPLSQEILGRDNNHMAALGMSLHMRHTVEEVRMRYGHL